MTNQFGSSEHSGAPADIDFERASFEATESGGPMACSNCEVALTSSYFTAGEAVVCEQCRYQLEEWLGEKGGLGRFARAGAFGFVAAAVGALIWGIVTEVTGYEIGLVAIVVGWVVGAAVRAGTGGRGGLSYQFMAVALTYLAIVSTYVPHIIAAMEQATPMAEQGGATPMAEQGGASATAQEEVASTGEFAEAAGDEEWIPTDVEPVPTDAEAIAWEAGEVTKAGGTVVWLITALVVLAIAMAAPFLAGLENAIGLLIIGFALWQAWSSNKRTQVSFEGPFKVGAQGSDVA